MFIGTQCDLWGKPDGTGQQRSRVRTYSFYLASLYCYHYRLSASYPKKYASLNRSLHRTRLSFLSVASYTKRSSPGLSKVVLLSRRHSSNRTASSPVLEHSERAFLGFYILFLIGSSAVA